MSDKNRIFCNKKCGRPIQDTGKILCDICIELEDINVIEVTEDSISEEPNNSESLLSGRKTLSTNSVNLLGEPQIFNNNKNKSKFFGIIDRLMSKTSNDSLAKLNETHSMHLQRFLRAFKSPSQIKIQDMFFEFTNQMKRNKSNNSKKQAELFREFSINLAEYLMTINDFKLAVEGNNSYMQICIEKLLTYKLHSHLMVTIHKEENIDIEFSFKIRNLRWVAESHLQIARNILDIPIFIIHFCSAQSYLRQFIVHHYPVDKLKCLTRCCRQLFTLLREFKLNRVSNADDFLPLLVFCILRTNPPAIKSELLYISRYTDKSYLDIGEEAYYFTSLNCAVDFIENCSCSSFNVTQDEYLKNIQDSKSDIEKIIEDAENKIKKIEEMRDRLTENINAFKSIISKE